MIRQEMKRLFSSWMFRAVLIVSLLIPFLNTYETWQVAMNDLEMTNQIAAEQTEWVFLSVFAKWIGIETYTSGYSLFFFAFPLLVCIGYGWSFRQELDTRICQSDRQPRGKEAILCVKVRDHLPERRDDSGTSLVAESHCRDDFL